mgnify:CR=1 FL=1
MTDFDSLFILGCTFAAGLDIICLDPVVCAQSAQPEFDGLLILVEETKSWAKKDLRIREKEKPKRLHYSLPKKNVKRRKIKRIRSSC